jgi:hypothetical protein
MAAALLERYRADYPVLRRIPPKWHPRDDPTGDGSRPWDRAKDAGYGSGVDEAALRVTRHARRR